MRRLAALAALLIMIFSAAGCENRVDKDNNIISVTATVFPAYDLARAVAGERAEINMLLPPGVEIHNYEPAPADMRAVAESDLFIYNGGESESWVNKVIKSARPARTVSMCGCSRLIKNDHGEPDEHVWLSPENDISILSAIERELSAASPEDADYFAENARLYAEKITAAAADTKRVISAAKSSEIIVADKFPLLYFCDYFGLSYIAAFDACDPFSDADARTVVRLIDAVKSGGRFVYTIENGAGYLADTVCRETGAQRLVLHSMHTLTPDEFSRGVTIIDLMERNKNALFRGLS